MATNAGDDDEVYGNGNGELQMTAVMAEVENLKQTENANRIIAEIPQQNDKIEDDGIQLNLRLSKEDGRKCCVYTVLILLLYCVIGVTYLLARSAQCGCFDESYVDSIASAAGVSIDGRTHSPSLSPTAVPSLIPTQFPSIDPTISPSQNPTKAPSNDPTMSPSESPSNIPTQSPSKNPTKQPTMYPTKAPSKSPTNFPSESPTKSPSKSPSNIPTQAPSSNPTKTPSYSPTKVPSSNPTVTPTSSPTKSPSNDPTKVPTNNPTTGPTKNPSLNPTTNPTNTPTNVPSPLPTIPTVNPTTSSPTPSPTGDVKLSFVGDFKLSFLTSNHDTWLLCDGTYYDSTVYTELWALIGSTYGISGSLFRVPNIEDYTLGIGTTTGSETRTLSQAQMPSHYHNTIGDAFAQGFIASYPYASSRGGAGCSSGDICGASTSPGVGRSSSTGSGSSFNIMQPTFFVARMFINSGQ